MIDYFQGGRNMANKFDIDSLINQMAVSSTLKSFYAISICRKLNLPIDPVLERLNYLVSGSVLNVKYEIRCDNDSHIIAIVDNYKSLLGKDVMCSHCDRMIIVDLENIYPLYFFNNEYVEHLKKKPKPPLTLPKQHTIQMLDKVGLT